MDGLRHYPLRLLAPCHLSRSPMLSKPSVEAYREDTRERQYDPGRANILALRGMSRLEKPCMDHLSFLVERAATEEGGPCGHALMATCPPDPPTQMSPTAPFGYTYTKGDGDCGQRTWELNKGDLSKLMDLSKKLDLDGEITPVMAWGMVMAHPRFTEMKPEDFVRLAEDLKGKVRCYG